MKASVIEIYNKFKGEVEVMQNDNCMALLLELAQHSFRQVNSPEAELLAKSGLVKRVDNAIELSEKGQHFLSLLGIEAKRDVLDNVVDRMEKIKGYLSNKLQRDVHEAFEIELFENEELLDEVVLMRALRDNADSIFSDLTKPDQLAKKDRKTLSQEATAELDAVPQTRKRIMKAYSDLTSGKIKTTSSRKKFLELVNAE